ncbi:MAG: phage major capsid protein [Proteobacteria bacterium]|nr:phage major capsid protein [Pseudomonadota bacterium]
MESKDFTAELKELASNLEGKSKQEVKDAIEAFEVKNKEAINSQVKEVKDGFDAQVKELQKQHDELNVKMQSKSVKTEVKSTAEQIKDNRVELKGLANRSNHKEVEIKADVTRASVSGNAQAVDLNDIGQLATRKLSMYDAFQKIPVSGSNNNGTIRYYDWDEDTIARAAAMVAEGAAFPESTAAWKTETVELRKVGDTLPVTEEFFEDEAMFAAELGQFLRTNVDLKIDDQLCNGDGTAQNLNGLFASIDAYSPVASGITDASVYDLFPKVKESITTLGGSKYAPNVAFMNIADINKYKLKKDGNNNYIIPPFVSRDGGVIDGVLVIESNVVTANSMVLGDNKFARIYEKAGVTLSQGTVDAQFTSDMTTLKVRKRLLFLIRGADKGAWKKVTDIDAALVTLAS